MAKPMPVGTIRSWANGDVIKAHDNSIFNNGWIPLSTSEHLEDIGRTCDRLANEMINYKLPINGERFLDHEITEFKKPEGREFGPYVPDDFKQYGGFYGVAKYSFRNEFSKRYMDPKIKLAEEINVALMEANEEKARELGKHPSQFNEICLTDEEIDKIKKRIRASFKLASRKPFDVAEATELKGVVERTYNQLKQGLDFEGKQKEVYDNAKHVAETLPTEYERLGVKKQAREDAINSINETFPDNWGVRESFKSYIDDKYADYIRKYKKEIYRDEAAAQEKLFGVKLDTPYDQFYPKVFEKIGEDILAQKRINLKDYKGKIVFLKNGKKVVIGEDKSIDQNNEQEIKEHLVPPKYPYKELVQLRFEVKYGKVLEGNWPVNTLMAIHNIEEIMTHLPDGHFLTNKNVKLITNTTYRGGENGGYAWYNGSEKRINLSEDCVSSVQVYGKLANMEEFNGVMSHEVGHAVSDKFGRDNNLLYKQFVVACGWSYQQKPIREHKQATGNDKDIKREGSNQDIRLITEYAHKSPEEAFAEYYSFYYLNKKAIDTWLDTDNDTLLKQKSEVHVKENYEGRLLIDFDDFSTHKELNHPDEKVERLAFELKLNNKKHFEVDLINPWKTKVTQAEEDALKKKTIAERKNWNPKDMPPTVSIKQPDGTHLIINGAHRREQSKLKKKYLPNIAVSFEAYDQLKKRGVSDTQISNWAYNQNKMRSIPYQDDPIKMVTGISYRNSVVPITTLKAGRNIFKKMKTIFESPDLQKALSELGIGKESSDKLSWKKIKKALTSVFQKAEVPTEEKEQYADCIIRNPNGKILLLYRGNDSKLGTNKWCLPGGHIETGETSYDAAKRELQEETGIITDLMPVTSIEKDNCIIHYFEALIPTEELPQLNNEEHFHAEYVDPNKLGDYDLIFDLGDILDSLKEILLPLGDALICFSNPEEAIAIGGDVDLVGKWIELNSLFDQNLITEEDYFPKLFQIQKAAAMEIITRAFDDDKIDDGRYTKALMKSKENPEGIEEDYKIENLQKIAKDVPEVELQKIVNNGGER